MCNGPWELVVGTPAVRGRARGVTKTYYQKIVHQGYLWGRLWSALGPVSYSIKRKKNCEYLFTAAVTAQGGGIERYNIHS